MRGDRGFHFRAFWMLLLLSLSLYAPLLAEAHETHEQPASMHVTHANRRLHENVLEPSGLEGSMEDHLNSTEMPPTQFSQNDLEPCKNEEPNSMVEHMKKLQQLHQGFYNWGIPIPLSFDVGMRILIIVSPIIKMCLDSLLLHMLRARRHAAIISGEKFFLHGGPDSVKDELVDFAEAHYFNTHKKPTEEIQATEPPKSGSIQRDESTKSQQDSASPPAKEVQNCTHGCCSCSCCCWLAHWILKKVHEVKVVCMVVAGTPRGLKLFAVWALALLIEFTGPGIQSIGQWESTATDCFRVGISNTSNHMLPYGNLSDWASSMNDPLRSRLTLLSGTGESVGLEYGVNDSQLLNSTDGRFVYFRKTEIRYGDSDDMYLNEDVLHVNISQCLMEDVAEGRKGKFVSCLGNPEILDLHSVTAHHNVFAWRASIFSVGLQQALASAIEATLPEEEEADEQYVLKWLPFSQSAVHVRYIDKDLGDAEVECMRIWEYRTWACMFTEGDTTWVIDPTIIALDITKNLQNYVLLNATECAVNQPTIVPTADRPIPALRFQGLEQLKRADLKTMALARVAENVARGGVLPKYDAFSTAITLARAAYLQRSEWEIGVVHLDGRRKVMLSVPWILAVLSIAAFVIYVWLRTADHKDEVHVAMSSWEWYLQGAKVHAGGSNVVLEEFWSGEEGRVHAPVAYDTEFGYVADREAGEGDQKLTWVDGGAQLQAKKKDSEQSQAK